MKKQARKPKQLTMIPDSKKVFGGALIKGNPKGQRPLSSKTPLHLVLKANRGFGARSMLHPDHVKKVNACVRKQAEATGIRLYHFVNMGNHLHLVVKIQDRRRFRKFIRAISGLIARKVLGTERGPTKLGKGAKSDAGHNSTDGTGKRSPNTDLPAGYWIKRPFTRVASWGKDYAGLGRYMLKNQKQVRLWGPEITHRLGSKVPGFDPQSSIEPYRNSA